MSRVGGKKTKKKNELGQWWSEAKEFWDLRVVSCWNVGSEQLGIFERTHDDRIDRVRESAFLVDKLVDRIEIPPDDERRLTNF